MYLKKMEIKGFKSFPDKTEILFPQGLISVVGPNGSGKSNILDAIRWVLGEQSMKSLRGEKLEDVIFSGTEKRKEMNHCEVSLLIDNKDKMIDIDYSEINIKRKAFKSGESQFFINNKSCRLKDIKELLLDTGIGREGYSIISQGKIEEIVNGNSQQRRRILEEAAGITKFRYKKEESEKKLNITSENLERINDIYKEVEKQILPLELQKNKAEKYLVLKEKLVVSDVSRLLKSYYSLEAELLKIKNSVIEFENTNIDYNSKLNLKETEIKTLEENFLHSEKLKNLVEQEHSELKNNLNNCLRIKDVDAQKIKNIEENLAKSYLQKQILSDEIKANEELFGQLAIKYDELINKKIELDSNQDNQRKRFETLESELKFINEQIETNRNKILSQMNEQSRLISRNEILLENINDLEQKQKLWKNDNLEIVNQIEDANIEIINTENIIDDISKEIDKINQTKSQLMKKITEINIKIESLKTYSNKINLQISENSSKVSLLKKMESDNEGLSKGVKETIANKDLKGICGAVANLIQVKPGYEKALEAVLGGQLQNIIIESSSDVKKTIEFLKENKLGRVTFLPMDTISGKDLSYSDSGLIAIDAVDYDQCYKNIFSYLLGRTVIVEDMNQALAISKKYKHAFKIVTKEGEIFNAGGSITGGSLFSSNSIFTRRKQITEYEQMLNVLNIKIQETKLAFEQNTKLSDELKIRLINVEEDNSKKNSEKNEVLQAQKTIKMQFEYLEKRLSNSNNEAELIEESLEAAKKTYKKEKSEAELYEVEINSMKAITNELINQKNLKSGIFSDEDNNMRLLDIEKARLIELINSKQREVTNIQVIIDKNKETLKVNEIEALNNQHTKQEVESNNSLLDKEIVFLTENINKSIADIKKYMDDELNFKEALNQEREALRIIEKDTILLESKIMKLESDKAKIDFQKISYIEKLEEEYSLSIEEAANKLDENADTTKSTIDSLKKLIQELGNVNIDAINEYDKVKERYEFYKEQKEDLEDSIKQINEIINNLEKNMIIEFTKSFHEVNLKFDEVFKILFGGGNGKLILSNEADILASDIEINVQPPGKKVKSISVLSGGEKALSAIAILFAIIMRKPVPFCVLDEIDAPLDDANIIRFISLLNILSEQTQFIIITHRRGTMESSEYIYGITMQDKGVSKVLSLKLEEAQNYIEN